MTRMSPLPGVLNNFRPGYFRGHSRFDVQFQKLQNTEMSPAQRKTTVYFDAEVHQALRLRSLETERSLSDLVNEAVQLALGEDFEDLAGFEERAAERNLSFESVVQDLERRGRI